MRSLDSNQPVFDSVLNVCKSQMPIIYIYIYIILKFKSNSQSAKKNYVQSMHQIQRNTCSVAVVGTSSTVFIWGKTKS